MLMKQNFKIESIEFHSSQGDFHKIPQNKTMPQVAFCGRSNSGKSSLINAITQRKELAKVSATPGKTRVLNFFLLNKKIFLVDLPGFGYAKASNKERDRMIELVNGYLNFVDTLKILFILCDSKRELPEEEKGLIQTCFARSIIPILVRTKVDKLNQKEKEALKRETQKLKETFPSLRVVQTSTTKNYGIREIQEIIFELL